MSTTAKLYKHQQQGIDFLRSRSQAMLADEMGLGKTRQALIAASQLRIDRVLVLCPAAVRYSWKTEIEKLNAEGYSFVACEYKDGLVIGSGEGIPVLLVSYSLLPRGEHTSNLCNWCSRHDTLMIADESSFLKNRNAKQTQGALRIGKYCKCRWLLTGTPIANSPLDMWGQGVVLGRGMYGPLKGFSSWWQFRARYAVLKRMKVGAHRFDQVVDFQNVEELQKKFAPYVLRREKKECLDLPDKTYEVREVALREDTWKIYQELRKEAMLCLPDSEERPEPNAAVRLLRLCQITSGHVGAQCASDIDELEGFAGLVNDISSEKLDWLTNEIVDGELEHLKTMIVWCRWRRERERLSKWLEVDNIKAPEIHGSQTRAKRDAALDFFANSTERRVLLAQPHAGGFGLNLTAASTAIYLSNDFSYTTRIQSEDRTHRIGQRNPTTYIDILATGPKGQRTIDHYILETLRSKHDVAQLTCAAWKRALDNGE